jgi:SNF2 family DNA or RNA helicase
MTQSASVRTNTSEYFDFGLASPQAVDAGPYSGRADLLVGKRPVWAYSLRGDWGQARILLVCADSVDMSEVPGWKPSKSLAGHWISVHETLPSKEFLLATSQRFIQQYPEYTHCWQACGKTLGTLPRAIWQREDESCVRSTRRQRRELRIRVGFKDRFLAEFLRWAGARWDKDRHCLAMMARPEELDLVETVLACWGGGVRPKPPVYSDEALLQGFPFLFGHQVDAARFIFGHWAGGRHGCLVADDMGLGKTVSLLSTGTISIQEGAAPRMVVLGPSAVLKQWKKEWIKRLNMAEEDVFIYVPSTVEKLKMGEEDLAEFLQEKKLIVSNYEFVRMPEHLRPLLPAAIGAFCVFDEATKCKSETSDNFRGAMFLSMCGAFSVALSGTPVMNNIAEMWNIMRLVDPGIMPQHEFYDRHVEFKDETIWRRGPDGKPAPKVIRVPHYHDLDGFNAAMKPYFIRRLKTDMPGAFAKKTEEWEILPVEGTVEGETCRQIEETYRSWHRVRASLEDMLMSESQKAWQLDLFSYLQAACDDPYILFESPSALGDGDDPEDPKVVNAILAELDREALEAYVPVKARRTAELIAALQPEQRSVVFTNYVRTARRLESHLGRITGRTVFSVTGRNTTRQKDKSLAEFESTPGAILVCTDSLSMGTDLPFASLLVHYSLPWEPATYNQRTDRIHRMGAKGDKRIVVVMTEHDVEQHRKHLIEGKGWIASRALQR